MVQKFKIRAELDQVTKSAEFERGAPLALEKVKSLFESKFGFPVALRYKSSDGRVQPLYQDVHLEDALKDAEKNNLLALNFIVARDTPAPARAPSGSLSRATGASMASAPSSSGGSLSRATGSNAARQSSFSASSSSNVPPFTRTPSFSNKPKFCEECGSNLQGAKFCGNCGTSAPGAGPVSPRSNAGTSVVSPRNASDDGGLCAGCGNAISGSAVRAIEKMWHKECFLCSKCHKSLLEGGFVRNGAGELECSNCHTEATSKKCNTCNKQIVSGSYLSVEGKDYHKECFTCSQCNGHLEGGYYNRGGKAVCKNCA